MEQSSYQGLATGMMDLTKTWDALAAKFGESISPTSQCSREARMLSDTVDQAQLITRTIAHDGATYVSAAVQHLRALAGLLGPDFVLTGWPVTRALVEHCGRAAWLLSPNATPTGRIARFFMERIVSLHMARMSTQQTGDKASAKELKKERTRILVEAQQIFPGTTLYEVGELNTWSIGGEPYAGLSRATKDFSVDSLGIQGLYDTLSTLAHPSLYRLGTQTRVKKLDGRSQYTFAATPEVIHWQLVTASGSVYRTAHHVVGYLGIDPAPLERWAQHHPALLHWAPAVE